MGYVVLGWDGEDEQAAGRRAAVRSKHLEVITRWAEAGRLNLAVPLFRADGSVAGSIMIFDGEDEVGTREYLLEEPFAREGVWLSYQMRPYRIAPLDYQPLPFGPMPSQMTHSVVIAEDGTDAEAPSRRAAVRGAHIERVGGLAADGTLACGGALLGLKGEMLGSIAITKHPTEEEARAFWAEDPYVTGGVWQKMQFFTTRFAALPYKPLPRPE
ncbi:MAG: hypothetical protein JWR10_1872 [Rubritepida sp.]|nr:hypothetical protein [Rubritepida sp.]